MASSGHDDARRRLARGAGAIALGLTLAWCALAVCGYRFGAADQIQYLSHYTIIREPGALAGDPYAQAFASLGSLAWAPIAWTTPEHALPVVALALMLACATASALVLTWLGRSLLGRGAPLLLAAAPALVLVMPKEQNYLGLVSLGDVELTATAMVMTLVFASMAMFARGRVVWSLALALAAAPIHGQTAAYLLGAWCAATVLCCRRDRRLLALALAVGAAGVVGAALARTIGAVPPERMGEYADLGRELYAPLIDIRSVPLKSWVAFGIVMMFGALSLPGYLRRGSAAAGSVRAARERFVLYGVGSLAFPVIGGALLALGAEEPLLWRLMVPRSLMLAQIVSVVVAGVWAADRIRAGGPGARLGALALLGLTLWPTPMLGHTAAAVVGLVTLAAIALGGFVDRGQGRTAAAGSAGGVLGAAPAWTAAIVVGAIAFTSRDYPWLTSPAAPAWRDAQTWARTQTPEGSVFLTPPYLAGWRVGSHRPTYGELRDGGLLFYAGEPALDWEARMRTLGMAPRGWWFEVDPRAIDDTHETLRRAYAVALAEHNGRAGTLTGADFLVVERGDAPGEGRLVHANELFVIYRLGGE